MKKLSLIWAAPILLLSAQAHAQQAAVDPELEEILSLDIGDLTVTSASKREQKLADVPAAIYVITQEDLHRAGVTSIPEALRMVPGMQVAQTASNGWAVSARGFNGGLSNKLLVLIDGRTVYTPIFSGTYWDDQGTLIEDIDRIEVIRGPGGTLWGANAVDGVINIITKKASDTQGDYASAAVGNQESFVEGRHGGKSGDDTFYRTYAQYANYGPSESTDGSGDTHDAWWRARSGFRVDSQPSHQDGLTLQGDVNGGRQQAEVNSAVPASPFMQTVESDNSSYGANILGRWNHEFSPDSTMSLQAYIDNYSRVEAIDAQHVTTGDIEFQHNVKLDDRNNFIWGGGARVYGDDLRGSFDVQFDRDHQTHEIFNTFAQDEYALIPNTLYATLGSKFEYNDFTGFEAEPNARLLWHPVSNQTLWGAVSRAVRTPSDIEEDVSAAAGAFPGAAPGAPPEVVRVVGDPRQKAEDLIAYEVGHRIQPTRNLSFDTTAYFNDFTNLETVSNPGTPFLSDGTLVVPYGISNLGSGHVYGAEEAASWNVTSSWRLMASYTYMIMHLDVAPGAAAGLSSTEQLAPRNSFSIRSYWNITDTVKWDNMLYYVSAVTSPADAYFRYDARIAWQVTPGLEASLIGRNLLDSAHPEFPEIPQTQVPRSVLARLAWKF